VKQKTIWRLWIAAISAAALSAAPPQAAVSSPNGGENLVMGTEYTIIWNCSNCAGSAHVIVEIANTIHSGPGYSGQISPAGVPMSQGFFKWQAVGKLSDGTWIVPGPGYRIHLEAIDGSDASDGTFSILAPIVPAITVTKLDLAHWPECPECVRIDLRALLDDFRNCRGVYRIALFAEQKEVADLGKFGGRKRMNSFLLTRISRPLQALARDAQGRFELRLFDARGLLLQTKAVRLIFLRDM